MVRLARQILSCSVIGDDERGAYVMGFYENALYITSQLHPVPGLL